MSIRKEETTKIDQEGYLSEIQKAHRDSGRTLFEVGEMSGVDKSYVHRVLNGERRPRRDVLIALCQLGWNLDLYSTEYILKLGGYKNIMDWKKMGWD